MKFLANFIAALFLGIAYASDEADVVEILPKPMPMPIPRPRPLPIIEPVPLPEPLPFPEPFPLPEPLPMCDIMCTMEYMPVCALPVNGCGECQTFSNACGLGVYNCNNPTHQYYVYTGEACDSIGKGVLPVFGEAVSEL